MKNQEPCSVCGSKDLNLIDGFYYCVECGTQDVNAREVVVNTNEITETTLMFARKRKIREEKSDAIEMSAEWTKWHAYNFMLSGLADEMVTLGASPSFKLKLLWIWTRYMARFHVKEDVLSKSHLQQLYEDDADDKQPEKTEAKELKSKNLTRFNFDAGSIDTYLILSFIYMALNLDQSDFQISHLQRFIQENRFSITHCAKFVPKELEVKKIPNWGLLFLRDKNQVTYRTVDSANIVRLISRIVFAELDLGVPNLPDLRTLVNNYVKELCLPEDFRNLVYSLMHYIPCIFTQLRIAATPTYVHDYEAIVMSYVIVGLKLCFGLDDEYENYLSDEVERINSEENRRKSHKLGQYSDSTDRLFSFREWCSFLHFRKLILSKYYIPIALDNYMEIDDYAFMEQSEKSTTYEPKLHERVAHEMLLRIPLENEPVVIPQSEFVPTLTPLVTYSEVILQYFQDPELRLILSEDFTRYSMKYACMDLNLQSNGQNIIKGVSNDTKIVDEFFYEDMRGNKNRIEKIDMNMVFVKDCDNRNWLKTKPPTKDHIKKIEYDSDEGRSNLRDSNEKDSDLDHGYDSDKLHESKNDITVKTIDEMEIISDDTADLESLKACSDLFNEIESKTKVELMCEESAWESIFDDDFADLIDCKKETYNEEDQNDIPIDENYEADNHDADNQDNFYDNYEADNIALENDSAHFDPNTFDREVTIKKLVLAACEKYKIPKPLEYKDRPQVLRKRKTENEAQDVEAKKKKTEADPDARTRALKNKEELDRIMTAYYASVERQLLQKVSQTIENVTQADETDILQCGQDYPENRVDNNDDLDRNSEFNAESSCVIQDTLNNSDNEDLDVEVLKDNPKFDPKIHDTRQLYIKFKDELNIDEMLDTSDPEIEKIIAKQLEKREEVQQLENKELPKKNEETKVIYDTSDDEPLINFARKENVICKKRLLDTKTKIKSFKYWMRHYGPWIYKDNYVNPKFDKDLLENFPKSFIFIINECALMIKSNPYLLYKRVERLERALAKKIQILDDT